jgi:hypothetical protein
MQLLLAIYIFRYRDTFFNEYSRYPALIITAIRLDVITLDVIDIKYVKRKICLLHSFKSKLIEHLKRSFSVLSVFLE